MPIQIQEINEGSDATECPLCMEPLEADDINFFPCVCGYQVCRFCWHRIRTDENGLCPACRTSYPENPAEFKPLTGSDLQKIRNEKRQKEVQRRQKLTDNRRHLSAIRVLQKNLVFVVGLSHRLSDPEVLKKQEYFGKYGKIIKVVINNNTAYAGSQGPSSSAYVTYSKMEEALGAIQSVNNVHIDGRTLKASLGTTKYCSTYLKNQQCHKSDCMYLHELAEEEASFTKEDMQAGKHQEVEQKLIEQMLAKEENATEIPITNGTSISTLTTGNEEKRQRHHSGSSNHSDKKYDTWLQPYGEDQFASSRLSCSLDTKHDPGLSETYRRQGNPQRYHPKHSPSTDGDPLSSECSSNAPTPPPPPPSQNYVDSDNRLQVNENYINTQLPSHPISIPPVSLQPDGGDKQEQSELKQSDTLESLAKEFDRFHLPSQANNLTQTQTNQFSRLIPTAVPQPTFSTLGQPHTNLPEPNWQLPPSRTSKLSDEIHIKTTSDWEAAFGFSNNTNGQQQHPLQKQTTQSNTFMAADAGDDDLGFDPWLECNKGLADLIQKECAESETPSSNYARNAYPTTGFPINQFGLTQPSVSSGFLPNTMGSSHPMHQQIRSQEHIQFQPKHRDMPNANGLSEWQNGLRALLPSVNINFAMDKNNELDSSGYRGNIMPHYGRLPPTSHTSPNPGRNRPVNPMGYDHWGVGSTVAPPQQQSNFLSGFHDRRNPTSFMPKGVGLGSMSERYSPVAPPPGLATSVPHQPSDPAIIAAGQKPAMQVPMSQHQQRQQPINDETPHWMKSLQTLADFDTPLSSTTSQSIGFNGPPAQQFQSNASWPFTTNSVLPPFGTANQPPPGFESRLPYTNSSDFGLRHSLLENQS
uniref:CCR4-NOT transcription complex subunit 4 n=1 Tax=Phallusia mammillata TaxID=59560 RepID=A0A6F9DFG8_9ASCI|nr:uncharacterized protein LOC100175100 [Phallusia mammillata]